MKVGILGGGQLAQLICLAAQELQIETLCLCQNLDEAANKYSQLMQDDGSEATLQKFAQAVDVITLENENVEVKRLEFLQQFKTVYPPLLAIKNSQDRLLEKQMFMDLGIATVAFADIQSEAELNNTWHQFNEQGILKTRRFGYDGKGQLRLNQETLISEAWHTYKDQPMIVERFLPFDYEVSLIGARNASGVQVFYPLIKNIHQEGILRISEAPYLNDVLQAQAEDYMQRIFKHLDYVGVLAFEFFVKENQLFANEIAPRVHNSGHLTLEGATISQFHLHLLSILDQSLPQPEFLKPTAMINLIGSLPDQAVILKAVPTAHFYDYGKVPRVGRKLGHISLTAESVMQLHHQIQVIVQQIIK